MNQKMAILFCSIFMYISSFGIQNNNNTHNVLINLDITRQCLLKEIKSQLSNNHELDFNIKQLISIMDSFQNYQLNLTHEKLNTIITTKILQKK